MVLTGGVGAEIIQKAEVFTLGSEQCITSQGCRAQGTGSSFKFLRPDKDLRPNLLSLPQHTHCSQHTLPLSLCGTPLFNSGPRPLLPRAPPPSHAHSLSLGNSRQGLHP